MKITKKYYLVIIFLFGPPNDEFLAPPLTITNYDKGFLVKLNSHPKYTQIMAMNQINR